jgi:hypothetical protein
MWLFGEKTMKDGCSVDDCFLLVTDGTQNIQGPKSKALCTYNGYSFQSEYNSVSFGNIAFAYSIGMCGDRNN